MLQRFENVIMYQAWFLLYASDAQSRLDRMFTLLHIIEGAYRYSYPIIIQPYHLSDLLHPIPIGLVLRVSHTNSPLAWFERD